MEIKPVIKVDYTLGGEWQNEELFDDVEKAWELINVLNQAKPRQKLEVSIVVVNSDNLYHEEDGSLNYEDNSELYV